MGATKKAAKSKALSVSDLLTILQLFAQYGIPAIASAVDSIRQKSGPDFTVDEIKNFMVGVEPPIENP